MPEASDTLSETLLASALRGRAVPTPPRAEWAQLLASAEQHGVLPLLADAAAAARWDPAFLVAMRPSVAAEIVLSLVRERELGRVLASLAAAGITPLLLKGAHLAFTLYRSPDRRPRLDTDLLIKEKERDGLKACLASLGYRPTPHVTGEVAFTQFHYRRIDESGASHALDIHWRIAVPKLFADRLTYDDLRRDSVAVPRLGPHALAPSPPLALLVACLHRTAHHGSTTRLLWLYDLHLLATAFSDRDWHTVVARAELCGLTPVVAAGLEHAAERLGTVVPPSVLGRLHAANVVIEPEMRAFLHGTPSRIQVAASDWHRIAGASTRLQFLREHVFPPAIYMRHRYNSSSRVALPFLYVHRAVTGAVRWLKEGVRQS
jgi:hypothetical protein